MRIVVGIHNEEQAEVRKIYKIVHGKEVSKSLVSDIIYPYFMYFLG
jgi:hypothetical protein